MNIRVIPIKDIVLEGSNFDDFTFSFPLSAGALQESIRKVGLLQPVCLRKHERGWQIIFGARRILACKELGWHRIPAQVYAARDLSVERALEISLEEDIQQRELNPVEKARVLSKFMHLANWGIPKLLQDIAPRLGLPPSVEMLNNYLSLSELEKEYQTAVATRSLSPAHAFQLVQLRPDERFTIFQEVFIKCRPNLNEARELIENLTDLGIILKKSIKEILSIKTISAFLNSSHKNPREKSNMLRKELKRLRYPQLTKLEERFSKSLKSLELKSNIQVRPSPFFEEKHLDVSFRVKNPNELDQTVESMAKVSENGGFTKLFEIVAQ
ncbi:MAG: ParB/RepB/Spo0J family partition protein [bacterium]